MKRLIAMFLMLAIAFGMMACSPQTPDTPMDTTGKYQLNTDRNEAIINDAGTAVAVDGNARVFYQIFVGSFSDSNGDGTGDLRGIIERFDYLNDGDPNSGVSLGVEGIWLSPIFLSPSYHKYDVTDYYKIDPKFGTMEDLQELIELCHQRGVQLILDLVINHTAANNAWFLKFKEAHKNFDSSNEYYDFYTWSGENSSGWHAIPDSTHYYEGHFSGEMPELNYDNPKVREEMVKVAKFYLDMGIDGFRFDAAKYIYYGDTTPNYEFWDWYMAELRAIKPDVYSVAEVWDGDAATYPYFTSTNCFDFSMSQSNGHVAQAAKGGNVNQLMSYVDNYLKEIKTRNPEAMLCSFIANHDTDRAAGFLTVASGQAYMAANLNILLPGSPYIYYGEEIGMLGSRGGAQTDANRRLAMLWGDEDTVRDPVGANYAAAQANGTVADQLPNGGSLYNHYKKLIAIRKANPEIAYGELTPLTTTEKAGGFLASYQGKTVAVLHNTTTDAVTIDLAQITDVSLTSLAAVVGLGNATLEGTVLTIEGQTSVVLR